jgi:hypothetical protein
VVKKSVGASIGLRKEESKNEGRGLIPSASKMDWKEEGIGIEKGERERMQTGNMPEWKGTNREEGKVEGGRGRKIKCMQAGRKESKEGRKRRGNSPKNLK